MQLIDVLGQKGNIKIPKTTAIFNMSSAKFCSSAKLGLCKAQKQGAKCYARKAEYLYPQVLPFRNKQAKYWKKVTAEQFSNEFIEINNRKRNKFLNLRLNVSGDFHNQKEVNKTEKIATILKKHGVKTYCYTSRNDLNFSRIKNLIVSGSNFKKKGITNIFKIVDNIKKRPIGFSICKMNCKVCGKCVRRGQKIIIKRH